MTEAQRVDLEPVEPFNRADCVRTTVDRFKPRPPYLLGGRISLRYAESGDAYLVQGEYFDRLHSLDTAVETRIAQFSDPGTELTDEKLAEFQEQAREARRTFGSAIIARAKELEGLSITLSAYGVGNWVDLGRHQDIFSVMDNQYSDLNNYGWEIFDEKKPDSKPKPNSRSRSRSKSKSDPNPDPILLVLDKSKDEISFHAVRLDEVYARDPEFLRDLIKDFNEKDSMSLLAYKITYGLKLHEADESQLVPSYIKEIGQISDPGERAKAIQEMVTFMNLLVEYSDYGSTIVYNFTQSLPRKNLKMDDDRSADLNGYIDHMSECLSETPGRHEEMTRMSEALKALAWVNFNKGARRERVEDLTPVERVLNNPERYTAYQEAIEVGNVRQKEQSQGLIDFIDKVEDITDPAQILDLLSRELPQSYSTIIQFQEWLGTGYLGKSNFDELIESAARSITPADWFDFKRLNDTLGKELRWKAMRAKGKFIGVYTDRSGLDEGADIYNPHLEAILPLLAIKKAQADADSRRESDKSLRAYYERQAQTTERLTKELKEKLQKKVDVADHELKRVGEGKAYVAELKASTGITDEEIARLVEVTTKDTEAFEDFGPQVDSILYTSLFFTLVLDKYGAIDKNSPSFRAFLREFFPKAPEKVWQSL